MRAAARFTARYTRTADSRFRNGINSGSLAENQACFKGIETESVCSRLPLAVEIHFFDKRDAVDLVQS